MDFVELLHNFDFFNQNAWLTLLTFKGDNSNYSVKEIMSPISLCTYIVVGFSPSYVYYVSHNVLFLSYFIVQTKLEYLN